MRPGMCCMRRYGYETAVHMMAVCYHKTYQNVTLRNRVVTILEHHDRDHVRTGPSPEGEVSERIVRLYFHRLTQNIFCLLIVTHVLKELCV